MQKSELHNLSQAQRERLFFIDFRLFFIATLNRNDLISRFGIKKAAATRDITYYRKFRPDNAVYDSNAKSYLKTKRFTPLFDYNSSQVLSALSEGMGDDYIGAQKPPIYCEAPTQISHHPDIGILSALTNAISLSCPINMEYHSMNSGKSTREFVPFVLVDNGLRWHVRGYDRKNNRFGDFVLTRITKAEIMDDTPAGYELKESDIQWNRIVEMELVPHPNLPHPKPIELNYGMTGGVLQVNVRAAVAGYVLRRWNVDCTADHHLQGKEYHLWLRNTPALYGVGNLSIAPGYQQSLPITADTSDHSS